MAEGYKDWASGNVLTADDLEDYTVKQSVMRFASAAARSTALSGVLSEGMVSYLLDTDRLEVYSGSAWVRFGHSSASGRTGVVVTRAAAQTVNASTLNNISWTAETSDSDGFITVTSDTITIPSGLDGIYACSFTIDDAGGAGTPTSARLTIGGHQYNYAFIDDGTTARASGTAVEALAAAATVVLAVRNGAGGTSDFTGRLSLFRIAR